MGLMTLALGDKVNNAGHPENFLTISKALVPVLSGWQAHGIWDFASGDQENEHTLNTHVHASEHTYSPDIFYDLEER